MSSVEYSGSSGRASPMGSSFNGASPPSPLPSSSRPPMEAPFTHANLPSSRRWPADEPRPTNNNMITVGGAAARRHESKEDFRIKSELMGLDMSGFKIRTLTPSLARFHFLTELRLSNNFITHLPSSIGLLKSLSYLDLSNNLLMELPVELGWCCCLKELLLFNNSLQSLPGELGYLYQLENIMLEGNPLEESLLQIIHQQGAISVIPYLRDNLISVPPPPERPWHTIETYSTSKGSFTVLCYNILCDKYATPQMFGYVPSWFLHWDYRKQMILHEILSFDADIVCLQEVESSQYEQYFKPQLRMRANYESMFSPKSRARTMSDWDRAFVDGCAIFFKYERMKLEEKILIEFNQMALSRPSLRKHKDMYNRVMTRDNIALMARLTHKETRQEILVTNVHIHWDPSFRDVKLIQTIMLSEEIEKRLEMHPKSAVIVCGDFNSLPGSAVCTFLEEGTIVGSHPDFMGHTYEPYTSEGAKNSLHLRNAYSLCPDFSSLYTSFTPMFLGAIDYIWYRPAGLQVTGCLGTPPLEYTKQCVGLPCQHVPSDHVSLLAEFRFEGSNNSTSQYPAQSAPTATSTTFPVVNNPHGKQQQPQQRDGPPGIRYSTNSPDLNGGGSRRLFSRNKNITT